MIGKALSLLFLRVSTGLLCVIWGLIRVAEPKAGIGVNSKYYAGILASETAQYVWGCVPADRWLADDPWAAAQICLSAASRNPVRGGTGYLEISAGSFGHVSADQGNIAGIVLPVARHGSGDFGADRVSQR